MKIRTNYVSNSSSSSFLVAHDVSNITECIKLPKEIWSALDANYIDWEGNKLNLSEFSQEWWLTTLIYDGEETYETISELKDSKSYLQGNDTPYDFYDNENGYIIFKKNNSEFYINNKDVCYNEDDIPDVIQLRDKIKKIIKSGVLNKTQKLSMIGNLLDF
jgi:hypothetical protein